MRRQAPYVDYRGGLIYEGDTIVHPSGQTGKIVYVEMAIPSDRWRVDYGDGPHSRLSLQVGTKGQAIVIARKGGL